MNRIKRLLAADGGFSLIEATTAAVIAMIMVVILATVLTSSLRGAQGDRLHTAATSMVMEIIEEVREVDFATMAHHPSDISTTDPYIGSGLVLAYPGIPAEPLVSDPSGAVDPHVTTEVISDVTFTKRSYVAESVPGLKRVVAVVTWTYGGDDKVVMMETLVAEPSGAVGP